ncbi:MAG TPA: AsmA-like C-terminal region-containing protein, partial [Tenuifilaceae bacterium]|nr:AsmA-like C-terminal region-containing protein [Tenuifilaceae bacterium]
LVSLYYKSKTFNIQNLQELLSINYKDFKIKAKSTISGKVEFNFNTSKVDNLIVNHVSKGNILSKENNFIVNELAGKTQFTNNFKNHITSISKANVECDNLSAILSAKIKGLNNPIVLSEGLVKLNRSKNSVFGRMVTINASGNFKVLLNLKQTQGQLYIVYHNVSGLINFNIEAIEGIDKITDVKGTVDFKDDITIKSTGNVNTKPFKLNIYQNNFISVLNNKISLNPEILVDAEEIDVSYITEIISSTPETKETKPNNNTYRVKVDTKNLKYMNYTFQDVRCGMLFTNNTFEIQNFTGHGFDGTLSGTMLNSENKYFIKTDFQGMDISKLFNHYDNFKQTIVTHNNISGNLSGSAILNFTTNNKGEIDMPSIKMESDITISNGKLMGMNKIEKLSKWLKLDQVKSIDFKTLKNKIEISEGCVKIPKMDVLSNVVNMQLSGEHYFAGNFTYWMKVNFSQVLSRRFLNSSVTNDNEHATDGSINLYLKLFGDNNNYEVKLDKKSSFENIRGNIQAEGKTLKEIFREEFNQITKKDTILKANKDSSLSNKTKFNIEWDEYDTLNVDNN